MKYKSSFLKFYILDPLSEFGKNFLYNLNMIRVDLFDLWYCKECNKYHTQRVINYSKNPFAWHCIKGKEKHNEEFNFDKIDFSIPLRFYSEEKEKDIQ